MQDKAKQRAESPFRKDIRMLQIPVQHYAYGQDDRRVHGRDSETKACDVQERIPMAEGSGFTCAKQCAARSGNGI